MVIRLQDVAAKVESTAAEYLLAAAAAVLFDFGQARRACRVIAILDALAVVLKASRRAQASPVAVRSRVPAVAPFVPRRAHNAHSAYAVVARFAIGRLRAIRFFLAHSRYARFIRRADFVRIVASDAIPAYAQSRYALLVFGADFFTHRLCSRKNIAVFAQFHRPCLRRQRKQRQHQNQNCFFHDFVLP